MSFKSSLSIPGATLNGYLIGEDTDPSNLPSGASVTKINAVQGDDKGYTYSGGIEGNAGLFTYGSTGTGPIKQRAIHRDNFFNHWVSDYGRYIYRFAVPSYKDLVSGSPGYPNADKIASYQEQPSAAVDFQPGTTYDTTAGVTIGNTISEADIMPTYDGMIWTVDSAFSAQRIVLMDFYGNVHVDRALNGASVNSLADVITDGDMTSGTWYMTPHGTSDAHGMLGLRFWNTTNNGGQISSTQVYGIYNAVFINRDGHLVGVIPDPEYDVTSGVSPPTDYVGFGDPNGGGIQIGCGRIVISNPKWSDTSVNASAWTEGNAGNYRGKIYIYDLNFELIAEVTEPTPGDVNYFGAKVRIGYDRIYVTAPGYFTSTDPENTSRGNVYMYDLNGNLLETFNFGAYTTGSAEAIGFALELQDARVIMLSTNDKTNSNGIITVFTPDGEGQGVYFPSHSGVDPVGGIGCITTGNGLITYQHRLALGTYGGQSLAWLSIRDTYGFTDPPAGIAGRVGGFLDYERHTSGLSSLNHEERAMARTLSGIMMTPSAGILEDVEISDTDNTTAAPGIEFNEDGRIYGLGNQYSGGKYFIGYWNGGTTPRQEVLGSSVAIDNRTIEAYKPSGNTPNGVSAHGAATLNLNQTYDLPNGDGTPSALRWYWEYSDASSGSSYLRFNIRQKRDNEVIKHEADPDLMYFRFTWDNTGNTITETVSLSGSSSFPVKAFGLTPGTDIVIGWEFRADGTVYKVGDAAGTQQYSAGTEWLNTTPGSTYYIRFTTYTGSGDTPTSAYSDTLNTWHALTSTREVKWQVPSWTFADGAVKVEIATDSGGSNIVDTGYYGHETESGQ